MIKINNKIITTDAYNILLQVQRELENGKLKDIKRERGDNILISCPSHKDGFEKHASCAVYVGNDSNVSYGTAHCFVCGYKASFVKLVADLFNANEEFSKEWLLERFGYSLLEQDVVIPELTIKKEQKRIQYMNESELEQFRYYHPYMFKRKLTKEVIDTFDIGFDEKTNSITFPVRDAKGNLLFVTKRSVTGKRFEIPPNVEKPVYLLDFIIKNNINKVVVCESQINALTCYSYGFPAIALFGTGSEYQMSLLNNSPIRNYILAFDGDEAGRKGAERFKRKIRKDVFVKTVIVPEKEDLNSLSKEEVIKLLS